MKKQEFVSERIDQSQTEDFLQKPLFWWHVKSMLAYPVRYFRYRRKLKFLEKEFARQQLLATVPKSNALIETYRDELARTARSLYENPPIKIHGQERT